jgi:hypothetical protein
MPAQLVARELPCGNQGRQITGGPPGHEAATSRLRPAEQLNQPAERLVFREDGTGSRLPAAGEDVVAAYHGIEGKRSTGRCGWYVGQIQRIILSPSCGGDDIFEDAQRLVGSDAFRGNGLSSVGK